MMLNKWCLSYCFLKWDQTVWIRPFLLQHEQRRASATSHCKLNWSVGKHHIVADRLYNQREIAVICFAPAMIVLMRGVQDPEERDERVKRTYTVRNVFCLSFFERERERERERAGANPSSGSSFRQYNIKSIHRPYYTEHSKDIWQSTCNVSFHLNMHASILNSVPAMHTTSLTELQQERYYRLKNAITPRVFLSFSIAILP